MSKPTFDAKCFKCQEGMLHPFHDDGEQVVVPEPVDSLWRDPDSKPVEDVHDVARRMADRS